MRVAIQVPAFREGEAMRPTLDEIRAQPVPEYVSELSLEVWVTPTTERPDADETWQVAESAGFDVYEAPPGKLSARNAAHDSAADRGFDVIATWDADAPPRSDETLTALLDPFEYDDADAVRGNPVSDWHLFGTLENIFRVGVARQVYDHIHGQLSAFTAAAWDCAGPFDESLDQTELVEVWDEEEVDFARRLRECGRFVHARGAKVYNDSRRTRCRFEKAFAFTGRPVSEWCDQRGCETFQPRRDDRRR